MVKFLKILILTYLLNAYAHTKQSEAETSFLSETFNGNVPKKQRLIVKGEAKDQINIDIESNEGNPLRIKE